jgi:hypothetical protein
MTGLSIASDAFQILVLREQAENGINLGSVTSDPYRPTISVAAPFTISTNKSRSFGRSSASDAA